MGFNNLMSKTIIMVVGKGDNALLPVMMLGDDVLNWVRKIKNLGVCNIACGKFLGHLLEFY